MADRQTNLGFEFLGLARRQPDRPAILGDGDGWSYGQLARLVTSFALHMQRQGVGKGSTVAVQTDDLVVHLGVLFGTALLGSRWVAASGQLVEGRGVAVTHWLQSAEQPPLPAPGRIVIDASWAQPPPDFPTGAAPQFPGFADPEATWTIATTSGTTGAAKFLGISMEAMAARVATSGADLGGPDARLVCLFPILAFPYIVRALGALHGGATLVHSYNPMFWSQNGVTRVMGSPTQVWTVFGDVMLRRRLPVLHVGGGKTTRENARELLENFEEVVDAYGSREAGQIFHTAFRREADGTISATGRAVPGTRVEIVGEDGKALPAGTVGIVRVISPNMAKGYISNPEAEARAFRDGWFYPGDLGRMTEEGQLEIVGRENDQLNIGGVKLNALEIDGALMSVDGIRDAISFTIPRETGIPELVAFVSVDPAKSREACYEEAREACRARFGAQGVPRKIVHMANLPRNAGGKPDRKACALMALSERRRTG